MKPHRRLLYLPSYFPAFLTTQGGYFFFAALFFGTFLPSFRASERPIAIACLRLVTFLPLPPLFRVPRLRSCMAFFTFSPDALEYLRGMNVFLSMGAMNENQQTR